MTTIKLEVTPTAGASTNPLGITFGSTAKLEIHPPEQLINKDITGVSLTMVDAVGVYLTKGPLSALVPWSQIIVLIY